MQTARANATGTKNINKTTNPKTFRRCGTIFTGLCICFLWNGRSISNTSLALFLKAQSFPNVYTRTIWLGFLHLRFMVPNPHLKLYRLCVCLTTWLVRKIGRTHQQSEFSASEWIVLLLPAVGGSTRPCQKNCVACGLASWVFGEPKSFSDWLASFNVGGKL